MRFHIGYTFKIKHLIKWLLPIIVGLLAYFGIANMEVLAAVTDTPITGYYDIKTSDTQCNIFLGSPESLNIITNQVRNSIDYDNNTMTMIQMSNSLTQGWKSSNSMVRYYRGNISNNLLLSFVVTNQDIIETCTQWSSSIASDDRTASNCMNPVVYVYYCPNENDDINSNNCYYESINNYSSRESYNTSLKNNSWINSYKRTQNVNYDYITILYPNYTNNSYGNTPIGYGWEYYDMYLSDIALDTNSSIYEQVHNYCEGVNPGGTNSGGSDSVTEQVNQAIQDTLTGPNGVLTDPTLPNISMPFFDELLFSPTNIQGLLMFPINMLRIVTDNMNTCEPISFNLSSITHRWGNEDYILTLPCIRSEMQRLLGNWYEVFDILIASILFYYFVSNLILKINDTLSGIDTMPYFYTSSTSNRTTRPSLVDITREHGHRP